MNVGIAVRVGVLVGIVGTAGLATVGAGLGDPMPATTPTTPPTTTPAITGVSNGGITATIGEVSFLAGRWQGKMGKNKDNHVEEVWTNPSGNNVIGMFRWLKTDGTPSIFELLTIQEEEGSLALRLRHQTASGKTWESQDAPMHFRLGEKSDRHVRFDAYRDCGTIRSCRYELRDGKLFVEVAFRDPSAEERAQGKKAESPLLFVFERSPL